jgi:shikimate kinase/3-dehydroquinate synthase
MDVVLVGLPGSGKSAVGRRLARRHDAEFIDLDDAIESVAGARVAEIFAAEGEAGFRSRERAAVAALGDADRGPSLRRVIAPGGGAIIDPRNRWRLYRHRLAFWLDVRPEVLAQRLRHSPTVRPLIASRPDPVATLRSLATGRERFYGAARRVAGVAETGRVLATVDDAVRAALVVPSPGRDGVRLLDTETPIGRFVSGEGIAAAAVDQVLESHGASRAILVSEPGAWRYAGAAIADGLQARGRETVAVELPEGEASKRLEVVGEAARKLSRLRVERTEPLVAIGGGALGDTAGFLAAVWLRGVPIVHVPTTLVAQIDSSIGGKTAVDLPEGKNLVGAFHQPAAVVIDVSFLRTLPERHRQAALGEAVKMGVLGDERLLELLEQVGPAIAAGDEAAFESGAVAELVERCAWAKVEVVTADERETGATDGRIALNLGPSYGHALEAAGGYAALLHGEAVAFGVRGACRLGVAMGITPPDRAARIEALLDRSELGLGPLSYPSSVVLDALALDKKHTGGRLRWVLPTANAVEVRQDVPDALVARILDGLLAGSPAGSTAGAGG